MNQPTTSKVIKNKLGLLELARELGNVSRACKIFHSVKLIVSEQSFLKHII